MNMETCFSSTTATLCSLTMQKSWYKISKFKIEIYKKKYLKKCLQCVQKICKHPIIVKYLNSETKLMKQHYD